MVTGLMLTVQSDMPDPQNEARELGEELVTCPPVQRPAP
jgi:hypothetical protein